MVLIGRRRVVERCRLGRVHLHHVGARRAGAHPAAARGDDRYEMLMKLQSVLGSLGFSSIVVLMDRVDEPHLVNGSPERIRDLVWPMFDNKFLKHPGMAFKLLLPEAVSGSARV